MYHYYMKSPRTIFLGSPLESIHIIKAIESMGWPLVAICTAPDRPSGRGKKPLKTPVKIYAENNGLPIISPEEMTSPEIINQFENMDPEIIVLAAYGKLLPLEFLELAKFGAINVHPSILPLYRGSIPVQAAILAGDKKTGVSLMLMDQGLDTGPIIAQSEFSLNGSETTPQLSDKLFIEGANLLQNIGPQYIGGKIYAKPQGLGAKPLRRLKKDAGRVDWLKSAQLIEREVRAFTPWPGTYTYWRGSKVDILEVSLETGLRSTPGTVLKTIQGICIATGDSLLRVKKMKLEGKTEVTAEEFVRGQPDFIGATLPS